MTSRSHPQRSDSTPDEQRPLSDYGLQSERLLWPRSDPAERGPSAFEDEIAALELQLGLTTFGKLWTWVQTHSMWPDLFGTSCCTIEMMAVVGARYDIASFGMEAFRASPAAGRPADRPRARLAQDGGATAPDLRPDARTEMGNRDGRLRLLRRHVSTTTPSCRA